MISNFLKFVKKNLPILIIFSITFGLIFGYFSNPKFLKQYIDFILFLMIYPMMINLKVTDVFKSFTNIKPLLISLAINFLFVPFVAFGLGKMFFSDSPMLFVGLILIGLIPTGGMTASWTGLANGNLKLSLVLISINLTVSIIAVPIYLNLFVGDIVNIDTLIILKSLIKVVVIPLILGDITRRLIIKYKGPKKYQAIKPNLGGVSSLGVLLIVFVAMALKSKTILTQLDLVLISVIPLILFYIIVLFFSHFIGKKTMSDENRIALVYSTSLRNLTIALGISLTSFGESLAVFLVAIGYVIQLPVAALYMKMKINSKERISKIS